MIKIRKHESVTRALAIIFVLLFAVLGYLFLKPSRAANADVNGDGTVNILDLSVLASNWGLSGRTFAQGDLTGDGVVNVLDLSVLASNWGGGVTHNCTSPSHIIPMVSSDPNTGVSMGGFYITNDTWNVSRYAGQVSQTLYVCDYNNWYVTATMNNNTGDGAVKTYPNVHQDFINWGTGVMPKISSYSTITSSFAETSPSPKVGIYEWAYDIWLNGVADNNSTEVMIWNDNFNQVPGGSKQPGTVVFDGRTYDVWRGGSYIAFVDQTNTTSGTVDLKKFFNYITTTKGWLPTTSTIGQIDYGVELISTNNQPTTFRLTNFSLTAN